MINKYIYVLYIVNLSSCRDICKKLCGHLFSADTVIDGKKSTISSIDIVHVMKSDVEIFIYFIIMLLYAITIYIFSIYDVV